MFPECRGKWVYSFGAIEVFALAGCLRERARCGRGRMAGLRVRAGESQLDVPFSIAVGVTFDQEVIDQAI